jgi:hypothetical protein
MLQVDPIATKDTFYRENIFDKSLPLGIKKI